MLLTNHRLKSWGCALGTASVMAFGLAFLAPSTSFAAESDMASAIRAMKAAQVTGPAEVKLRDQATLKLPAGTPLTSSENRLASALANPSIAAYCFSRSARF